MRKQSKNDKDGPLISLIILLGLPLYLLMTHPLIFWLLVILFLAVMVVLIASSAKKHPPKNSHGGGFLSGLAGLSEGLSSSSSDKKHNHNGKCDGDCKNCPPHYGYRYGRWYYGHNHMEGCEFGGNSGSGGSD